jgi:hypothetical protein
MEDSLETPLVVGVQVDDESVRWGLDRELGRGVHPANQAQLLRKTVALPSTVYCGYPWLGRLAG